MKSAISKFEATNFAQFRTKLVQNLFTKPPNINFYLFINKGLFQSIHIPKYNELLLVFPLNRAVIFLPLGMLFPRGELKFLS